MPLFMTHVLVAPSRNIDQVRAAARTILAYYQMRPFYWSMFAAAGYPTEIDQPVSAELIDALVLAETTRRSWTVCDSASMWTDELVIGIVPGDDLRTAENSVLRLISRL